MNKAKLKIGRFSYSNLFPIFYMLEQQGAAAHYEFVDGVPSELNRLLRAGEIDISPSSSIEYLKNPSLYDYVEGHSISSMGAVGSILLFSRKPLEALGGSLVMMTYQSDTSIALLQIVLSRFFGLSCRYEKTAAPVGEVLRLHDAYLLIGDDALSEALRWPQMHIYDLGALWTEKTGLPFTYALWLIRKESRLREPEMTARFMGDLDRAKQAAMADLKTIAARSPQRERLSEEDLIAYWKDMIVYDFDEPHQKGLSLFREYAGQLGLI